MPGGGRAVQLFVASWQLAAKDGTKRWVVFRWMREQQQ